MTLQQPLSERVQQLERYIDGLQSELSALNQVNVFGGDKQSFRIAEITSTPIGTNDNTFSITFLDGYYSKVAGTQTPTYASRQTASRAVCFNLASEVIPVGTRLPVWQWNGHWWAWYQTSSSTPPTPTTGLPWHIVQIPDTTYGPAGLYNNYCYYDARLAYTATTPTYAGSTVCGLTYVGSGTPDVFVADFRQVNSIAGTYRYAGHKYLRQGLHAAARLYDAVTIAGVTKPLYGIFDHNDYSQAVTWFDVNEYVDSVQDKQLFPYATTRAQYGAIHGVAIDVNGVISFGDPNVHVVTVSALVYSAATAAGLSVRLEESTDGIAWGQLNGWPQVYPAAASTAIAGSMTTTQTCCVPATNYMRVMAYNGTGSTIYTAQHSITIQRAYNW